VTSAVPRRWWLGFAALVLALVGFAVWSVLLVARVRLLRTQVERNVGWLQDAHTLQRSTAAWHEAGGATPPPGWSEAADAVAMGRAWTDDAAEAVARTRAAIDRVRGEAGPSTLAELQAALDAAIAQVRRDSAGRSAQLGDSWGALSFLVFMALLLAGLVVALVLLSELRRRHALRLAAEIEATAETLAETRSELRAREAVAQLADELRVARDRAEEASAAKTRFMATMSHELLTPLNIILGYAELVRERCEEHALAEIGGDIGKLETAAQGLFRLLRHVLDLTELDSGALVCESEDVPLAPLLARVAEAARPLAARSGTALRLDVAPTLRARCDPRRLATAVTEVVDNACRFTRGGHVVLRAAARTDGVHIEVEDDGPGMREEDRVRATAPFFQADGSSTRAHDGAGLGLTVASRLCTRMGGTFTLRSAPGEGTTATIRVPLAD
jgi:signal transduction histidine kinase